MTLQNVLPPAVPLLILGLALLIDITLGEPPERTHPTVWMGKVISFLKPKIKSRNPKIEKINGVLLSLFAVGIFVIAAYLILLLIQQYSGSIMYVIVAAVMLKTTLAIKSMNGYTQLIAKAVEQNNLNKAKLLLPYVVRRDPTKLSEQQVLSAAVETIAESTVDGVTSPLFLYALFGVPGAFAFRAINTLDSMVGYKDKEHINIGWFLAKLDTVANYITARLTALLMIIAAWLLHENWRYAWRILCRDRNKTESVNAGWSMSAMAGALSVQLEKPGSYVLGDINNILSHKHVSRALRIMKTTICLFLLLVVIPLINLITTVMEVSV